MTTGEKISSLRTQCDYTQSDLAKLLGVTRSAVNAWEMGNSTPSNTALIQLADIFHVSTDYLLGRDNVNTVDLIGLTDEDVVMIQKIANYLRKKNK